MASATYTNVIPFPVLKCRRPERPAEGYCSDLMVERLKAAARARWPEEYGHGKNSLPEMEA